jgi:hypothetical protein
MLIDNRHVVITDLSVTGSLGVTEPGAMKSGGKHHGFIAFTEPFINSASN